MPVAFIGIVITLLFLALFKKVQPLGVERLFLTVELLLFLTGFFILPVSVFNEFNLNVMFGACSVTLLVAAFFKLHWKTKLSVLGVSALSVLAYFLLVGLNSDYLTFLTYLPLTIIALLGAAVFIKNANAGATCVLATLCATEVLNYFYLPQSMGYLTLFSVEFLNVAFTSVLIVLLSGSAFAFLKKHVSKTRRVASE